MTTSSLRVCLHELREALCEDAVEPRFIETVPRQGYRFIEAEIRTWIVTAVRRAAIHLRIGKRLEDGYHERVDELAAELAVHFERGRDAGRAIRYLQVLGKTAMRRHAYREAEAIVDRAMRLVSGLPERRERMELELTLRTALGPALVMTRGHAAPEVREVYARARDLSRELGESPQLFPVLQGLWLSSFFRAEHEAALDLGRQLLKWAEACGDSVLLVQAHEALGITLFYLGDRRALTHLERSIELYDPREHPTFAVSYANDPGVLCLAAAAISSWLRGYPDRALAQANKVLTLARELAHPLSFAASLSCRGHGWDPQRSGGGERRSARGPRLR